MKQKIFTVDSLRFLDCGPFSFTLDKGECVGLTGESGIGKTQLFRALSDLVTSTGNINFNGKAKDDHPAVVWRSQVSMLPTDSVWWYEDVADHFKTIAERSFLKDMCDKVGLAPEILDWQVSRLSTGEKQRLAILRSLQKKPTVLLLDEPTSALDAQNVKRVEELFLSLTRKKTLSLMWVSHDEAQLKRVCDSILVMAKDGIGQLTDLNKG